MEAGVFTDEEVDVAIELVDYVLNNQHQKDYQIQTATSENKEVLGYYCIGPTPLTAGTFDLYWIAVKPAVNNRGIGKQLLSHAEVLIESQGGRLVIAETSSQPKYERTRKFYLNNRYNELARIKDYYKIDDDLVIYGKYVSQSGVSQ